MEEGGKRQAPGHEPEMHEKRKILRGRKGRIVKRSVLSVCALIVLFYLLLFIYQWFINPVG